MEGRGVRRAKLARINLDRPRGLASSDNNAVSWPLVCGAGDGRMFAFNDMSNNGVVSSKGPFRCLCERRLGAITGNSAWDR